MDSKLVMDTTLSGATSSITIQTKIGMTKEPFELSIANEQQTGDKSKLAYMYAKQKEAIDVFSYEGAEWEKDSISKEQVEELKNNYRTPLDFGLYFNEVDSFAITSSDDKAIVIEGTISGSNMIKVLKETGALKQLSLTSFPDSKFENAHPIKVKAWVDPDTICITNVSIDMTETYQDLTNLLFDEDSVVHPQINQCVMEINNISINKDYTNIIPNEIQAKLTPLL